MMFEFATAARVLFGPGTSKKLAPIAAGFGRRALVVTGRDHTRAAPLLQDLSDHGLDPVTFGVEHEPTVETVTDGLDLARRKECDVVVGVGGGSAIDGGKAIAALLTNGGELMDFLEVIGRGNPVSQPSAPFIAVPTTAGTGAEVTRNAVVNSTEHRVKVSLRSPLMLPRLALVDPVLTHSMPPGVTASTGLDALTQVLEPYVCNRHNPVTDAICREGMKRTARSLHRAFTDGDNPEARNDMALASLLGGMALANAKLGAAHGFAGPIGGMFPDAPHGVICARMLPHVMETNIRALEKRDPKSPFLERYDEIARILTGDPNAHAAASIEWVHKLCEDLAVRPLSDFGLTEEDYASIVDKAAVASSMKGNPITLTKEELLTVLRKSVRVPF